MSKILGWLLRRPRLVIFTVIAIGICGGNYFISSILSNELIVRKIDNPYLRLTSRSALSHLPFRQSIGCLALAPRIEDLIKAKPAPQFAQQSDIYCGFLTDDYVLELDFPPQSPDRIPKGRFINISQGVVYTVLPNYGFVNPLEPVFVKTERKCSVLTLVGGPALVSVTYPTHSAYPCGTAQGIAQVLVNQYIFQHR